MAVCVRVLGHVRLHQAVAYVCVCVCVCGWVGVRAQSCLTLGARAVAYGGVCVCVRTHTCVLSYV